MRGGLGRFRRSELKDFAAARRDPLAPAAHIWQGSHAVGTDPGNGIPVERRAFWEPAAVGGHTALPIFCWNGDLSQRDWRHRPAYQIYSKMPLDCRLRRLSWPPNHHREN